MRPTFIGTLVIAATLHVSGASLSLAKTPITASKNVVSPGLVDMDGGRMLRRVEADSDEERKFSLSELLAKLSPTKAAKKIAKIEKALKEAGDHHQWLQVQSLKIKHGIK